MARVTIEDCMVHVASPFTLALMAAKRARQLTRGAPSMLPITDHKMTVIALQEIAGGQITESSLDEPDLPLLERPQLDLDPFEPSSK